VERPEQVSAPPAGARIVLRSRDTIALAATATGGKLEGQAYGQHGPERLGSAIEQIG